MNLSHSQGYLCISEYNKPEVKWNSDLQLTILSYYLLCHLHIQAYNTWCSQTHLSSDQAWCCLTLLIVQELVFQCDVPVSQWFLELNVICFEKNILNILQISFFERYFHPIILKNCLYILSCVVSHQVICDHGSSQLPVFCCTK